ncbi:MAG TPA: cytochrome c-type biogenesis protein CcmH [Myxococcaceae bacterium]
MIALALATALMLGDYAPQKMAEEMLPPEQEARVQRLGEQFRCPICQGLSIAASSSPAARAELNTVRALVREGKTDQEIRDYFVSRYGEWALLSPKAEGVNWLVWLGPAFLLIGGGFTIARTLRGPKASTAAAKAPAAPPPAEEDEYLRRVREEADR